MPVTSSSSVDWLPSSSRAHTRSDPEPAASCPACSVDMLPGPQAVTGASSSAAPKASWILSAGVTRSFAGTTMAPSFAAALATRMRGATESMTTGTTSGSSDSVR